MSKVFAGVMLGFLIVGPASTASAQSIGAGVSFMGDHRGAGFILDYSSPLDGQSGDNSLGWVAEFGLNHKGFGNDFVGVEGGATTIMAQGGLRMSGAANDKVSWLAQGLVGLMHTGFGASAAGLNKDICEAYNIDCSAGDSDNGAVLTFGGGVQYALSDSTSVRGQLDFPIAIGADGGATTRFSIMLVFKR